VLRVGLGEAPATLPRRAGVPGEPPETARRGELRGRGARARPDATPGVPQAGRATDAAGLPAEHLLETRGRRALVAPAETIPQSVKTAVANRLFSSTRSTSAISSRPASTLP